MSEDRRGAVVLGADRRHLARWVDAVMPTRIIRCIVPGCTRCATSKHAVCVYHLAAEAAVVLALLIGLITIFVMWAIRFQRIIRLEDTAPKAIYSEGA